MAQRNDLFVSKSRMAVMLTLDIIAGWRDCAAFILGIIHIVLSRTSKKVLGIGARWTVAFMENVGSVWNWAVVEFIRKAMRFDVVTSYADLSVPVLIVASGPVPTFIGAALNNFCPKAIRGRAQGANFVVMADDKPDGLAFDVS